MSRNDRQPSDAPAPPAEILRRKDEHIDLARQDERRPGKGSTGFEQFRFVHAALPEMSLDDVQLGTRFLGHNLDAPFLIGSMTGGPSRAEKINRHLAEAAAALGIAMGVGSQRVSLELAGDNGLDETLRQIAPDVLLISNIGAVQLAETGGIEKARRAVDTIGANAIFVHLNPLQEALQPKGDRDWTGVLSAIETLCTKAGVPVIVKEVGNGISGPVAQRLEQAGVSAVDVAGAGGTSWAWIESQRQTEETASAYAGAFADWGIPTADAIRMCRAACPDLPLIGSGGIRTGVDAAKAIHLGADIVSISGGVLDAAMDSTDAVVRYFEVLMDQLRIACFASGCASAAALGEAQTIRV